MSVLIAAAALAAWVYLLAARGGFWRFRETLPSATRSIEARVAAVIPARDEAEGIGRTVRSLLTQHFGGRLHLFVVDDHSTDGTASVAREAAEMAGASDRLRVIEGAPLPAGWTGKLWAVAQGVEAAQKLAPDYILLTDADIEHAPDSVASLIACAQERDADLTSVMVRLHAEHLAEALLIPAFVFFFFKLYPPRWVALDGSRTAAAAGGCMLVRPAALSRIGGIAAIRGEVIDDCALASRIKRSGGRIWMGLSRTTRSTREYRGFAEIRAMIARTAYTQLRYSPALLMGTVAGLALLYVAAPVLAFAGHGPARAIAIAAWLLMSISFLPALRFYEKPILLAPLLPVAALFYMEATIASAVRYYRGRGGQWKGRAAAHRG
jgi:hopene-associated glycosyltransferase HpnB